MSFIPNSKFCVTQGFTLVELVVVLLLIAVLAGVAVPIYSSYTEKLHREEGIAALLAILTAAKTYYYRNGDSFAGSVCDCETNNIWLDTAEICRHWEIDYFPADKGLTITVTGVGEGYAGLHITLTFDAQTGTTMIDGREV